MPKSSGGSNLAAAARKAAFALILSSTLAAGAAFAAAEIAEYRLKAAFLYNFAQFIEWPGTEVRKPFVISILGQDPFGHNIDALREGNVMDRPIEVRRIQRPEDAAGSEMIFIAEPPGKLRSILDKLRYEDAVTVGETADFVENGGIIRLKLESNKVRFEINKKAADEKGIKISSKLLSLASRIVD